MVEVRGAPATSLETTVRTVIHSLTSAPLRGPRRSSTVVDMPYTYILRCADDSYYVGSTWDLEARIWQHNSPTLGAVYTRRRQPVVLAWACWFDSIEEAYRFEKRVQGWSRRKREALMRGEYDALPDLSRRPSRQPRGGP